MRMYMYVHACTCTHGMHVHVHACTYTCVYMACMFMCRHIQAYAPFLSLVSSASFQGCRLRELPPILTFALLRFLYDYSKMERYKVE